MQLEKRVHDDTKVCQPSLSLPFTLGANTFSKKGHNLTIVPRSVLNRTELVFRSLEKEKEEEKDRSLI